MWCRFCPTPYPSSNSGINSLSSPDSRKISMPETAPSAIINFWNSSLILSLDTNFKAELRRKADCANQAKRVFFEAQIWLSNRPNQLVFQVALTANQVYYSEVRLRSVLEVELRNLQLRNLQGKRIYSEVATA